MKILIYVTSVLITGLSPLSNLAKTILSLCFQKKRQNSAQPVLVRLSFLSFWISFQTIFTEAQKWAVAFQFKLIVWLFIRNTKKNVLLMLMIQISSTNEINHNACPMSYCRYFPFLILSLQFELFGTDQISKQEAGQSGRQGWRSRHPQGVASSQ